MDIKLGNKIRQIRVLKGFSQDYLAEQLGISQRAYSKLETNQTHLNLDKVKRIADVFEIDLFDLVSFDENLSFITQRQLSNSQNSLNEFSEKLLEQFESRIKELQDQVLFLREELRKR